MKLIWLDGPEGQYECSCGHCFFVDAIDQHNLVLVPDGKVYAEGKTGRHLIPRCPQCGRTSEDDMAENKPKQKSGPA